MMTELRTKMFDKNCKSENIYLRPNAGHGVWLSSLLFLACLQTMFRNPLTSMFNYELTTILLFGMFLQSLEIYTSLTKDGSNIFNMILAKLVPSTTVTLLLYFIMKQDFILSAITASTVLLIYTLSFKYILKSLPYSFTFGEGSIVTQGLIIFLYNFYLAPPTIDQSKNDIEDLNIVLQIGITGVLLIISVVHFLPFFRIWYLFYSFLLSIIFGICLFPIGHRTAVGVLMNFIFNDIERIITVGVYIIFLILAGITVSWQIQKHQKGSTAIRKIFHILVVMVYLPGLIYQCHFLYVASVVMLAILIVVELARIIKVWPVSDVLDLSVTAFIDEKDAGLVALTPLYLLVGCSLPLWIHNSPCNLTGSSAFEFLPLISGILSIGVGDTFASIIGSKHGYYKWFNSNKTVEGTIASIVAQAALIYCLYVSGLLHLDIKLAAVCGVAIILNALIEALTDQVDNLVLPLVAYIILSYK